MTARVLLVRHAESSGQVADAPLTERGHAQAVALVERLLAHRVERIVSSPYLRARQTIAPFAARVGIAVETDARLRERTLSPQPIDGWRDEVRRSFDEPDRRVPGGESAREVLARGRTAVGEILEAGAALSLVVSHGQLLSLVYQSIDQRFGFAEWEALTNPDVHLVERDGAGALRLSRIGP
jgi:2,3-bisphosphoglycerate-dependent phosphoglycerate mutase